MPVVDVRQLHKRYGSHVAVHDASFTVEDGEIFGILGPNGAGKTTIAECIGGLRRPDDGTIAVLGLDPLRDRRRFREQVGMQLQQTRLPPNIRVREALRLYASFYRQPADCDRLIADLGLWEKRDALYRSLSGGQQQRLSIALALVGNPRLVILDELTTGLDPQARRDTWRFIRAVRERGVTVLLVTHFMAEAEHLCDRVAIIADGRVAALDTPQALTQQAQPQQRLHFRPSRPIDVRWLQTLPEVVAVEIEGESVGVTGTGNVVGAVIVALAQHDIVAEHLRVEQPTLDDAFTMFAGTDERPQPSGISHRERIRP